MTKVTYEEVDFTNITANDIFIQWERCIDCFHEIVKLVQSTGTTEQLAEMIKILAKYDIDVKDKMGGCP